MVLKALLNQKICFKIISILSHLWWSELLTLAKVGQKQMPIYLFYFIRIILVQSRVLFAIRLYIYAFQALAYTSTFTLSEKFPMSRNSGKLAEFS